MTATAHTDAAAQAASRDLGADAYAFGSHVAFAGDEPSLFVAAHEAAHTLQDAATVQAFGGRGAGGGDAHEAHADAVAQRVVEGRSAADLLAPGATAAGTPVVRRHEADEEHRDDPDAPRGGEPDRSARFENDASLASVRGGGSTVTRGQPGLSVTKLQQALIDLGYLLPRFGVDGIFEGETQAALLRFQADVPVPQTGELDQATIDALHARYDTRQPYVAAATHDPANPGTRTPVARRPAGRPRRDAAAARGQRDLPADDPRQPRQLRHPHPGPPEHDHPRPAQPVLRNPGGGPRQPRQRR
ncbi:MAG: peptidoglycan-binding protein [Kofleriaceae bacterium]|nr:peptidoglycan-binding protein [Kofleriaceae bacterium]